MENIYDNKIKKFKNLVKVAIQNGDLSRAVRLNNILYVYQQKANEIDMKRIKENLK